MGIYDEIVKNGGLHDELRQELSQKQGENHERAWDKLDNGYVQVKITDLEQENCGAEAEHPPIGDFKSAKLADVGIQQKPQGYGVEDGVGENQDHFGMLPLKCP